MPAAEEPLRSTVLLRYDEGLSAADISARQQVPGTVRWRLKAALDKLRAELDRAHGRERRAWIAIVAPLALDKESQGAPGAAVGLKLPGALSLKALLPMTCLLVLGATGLFVAQHRAAPPRLVVRLPPPKEAPAGGNEAGAAGTSRLAKQERLELLARIGQARQHSAGASASTAAATVGELDK